MTNDDLNRLYNAKQQVYARFVWGGVNPFAENALAKMRIAEANPAFANAYWSAVSPILAEIEARGAATEGEADDGR